MANARGQLLEAVQQLRSLFAESKGAYIDDKGAKNWHTITQDERVSVSVERALYERPGQDKFLVQIRVTNRTTQKIGVALDYGNGIHPSQWGFHNVGERGIIDERRMIPVERTDEKRAQLLKTFAEGELTFIPPNKSVTYYRDFNGSTGLSGRREVERQSKQGSFLIVSMDGQLFYTDGQSIHDVNCEWNDDFDSENSDVVLKLPIRWKQLPKTARVVEDPMNGFAVNSRRNYAATFDVNAHNAAEWDEVIHADIVKRIRDLIHNPETHTPPVIEE